MVVKNQTTVSYSWVKENVSNVFENSFTERQKEVFKEVGSHSGKATASAFVRSVVKKYNFSETSVWHILSKLKKMGFVDFGNSDGKKMLTLTEFGKLVKNGGEDYGAA